MSLIYQPKIPKAQSIKFIENFFIKKKLGYLLKLSKKQKPSVNQMQIKEPYLPELTDLYRLYQFIIQIKESQYLNLALVGLLNF